MNRPIPHIGQTMQHQRAMAHYLPMAEQAKHERAAEEVSGLLDRVRQAGTGECAVVEPRPSLLSVWIASLRRSFGRWWPLAVTVWAAYVGLGIVATVFCARAWS